MIRTCDWLLFEDVGELTRSEVAIDIREVEARAPARPTALDVTRVILHEDGQVIATSQTGRAEEVSEFINPRPQPAVGEGLARTRHDHGRLVGVGAMTELHGDLPVDKY